MPARALAALLLAASAAASGADDAPALPAAWHGTWTGTLAVGGAGGKREVPLTLAVAPVPGSRDLTWVLTYDAPGKALVKDYRLVPGDAPGRFGIDERNGIVLPARLDGNVLYSHFAVGGAVLTARYELRGDALRFEVTSARPAGKAGPGGVQGYAVDSVQTAELKKRPGEASKNP